MFKQGITVKPLALDKHGNGVRQHNGTWTGIFGDLQSGFVDICTHGVNVMSDRLDDFMFTTPFKIENFGALMKRQDVAFSINEKSVTAGIGFEIYAFLAAILLFLLIVTWFNERCQYSTARNSTWRLLLSLFPSNGAFWKNQIGATRKLLMTTAGFAVLVFSSLYQAKLSEQHMIPNRSPVVTFTDIEASILSGRLKMLASYPNASVLHSLSRYSPALKTYFSTHEPLYEPDNSRILDAVNANNGVEFAPESFLLGMLANIPDNECSNYLYVALDTWEKSIASLIMRKEQIHMLESWNAIVAERMSYVDKYIHSAQLSEECHNQIFPVYTPDPSYKSLKLDEFMATFALLFILCGISIFVLVGETVVHKFQSETIEEAIQPFKIRLDIGHSISATRRKTIFTYYEKILEEIANNENDGDALW